MSQLSAARLENIEFENPEEPSIEETLQYLEWLMRWYCREPSMLLATIIVSRLEWLGNHGQKFESPVPE